MVSVQNVSKVSLHHWMYIYLLSGDQFKIQTSFVLFWPPDIINFHLKSLFVITLVQSKQICSFDAGETHTVASLQEKLQGISFKI